MHAGSNLTPAEVYRLTGTVPAETLERLIFQNEKLEQLESISVYVDESEHTIAEDFLAAQLGRLRDIGKRLRGSNRQDLQSVIEELEAVIEVEVNASEYAAEQIKLAKDTIAELCDESL